MRRDLADNGILGAGYSALRKAGTRVEIPSIVYMSSSNQHSPPSGDHVLERAIIAYLLKTDESKDEWGVRVWACQRRTKKSESEEGDMERRLVLMLHYWHSFPHLRFSHSASRQAGTRVAL